MGNGADDSQADQNKGFDAQPPAWYMKKVRAQQQADAKNEITTQV
jgi:hypothetical protein